MTEHISRRLEMVATVCTAVLLMTPCVAGAEHTVPKVATGKKGQAATNEATARKKPAGGKATSNEADSSAKGRPTDPAATKKGSAQKDEFTNATCQNCHADKDNVEKQRLVVDGKRFAAGPHSEKNGVTCASCHTKAAKVEDVNDHGKLGKATCAGCHEAAQHLVLSMHGSKSQSTKSQPTCATCHGTGHDIKPLADRRSPVHPRNQPVTCGRCHQEGDAMANFGKSIHGQLLKAGKATGPTCSTCHSGHDVLEANIVHNAVYKRKMVKVCSGCHKKQASLYLPSVHGQALLKRRIYAAPSCVDCHLSHDISQVKSEHATVYKTKVVRLCAGCHGDARLIRKLKLREDVVPTYEGSFHGRAGRLGNRHVAICSSCHSYHGIFRQLDPRSTVHPRNLAKSCGKCHPSASKNFVQSKIHVKIGGRGNHWAHVVRQVYIWLIGLIIGGMIVHNLLDFIRKTIIRARQQRAQDNVVRMTRLERLLHASLAISFLSLCYTGFALIYPDAWWVAPLNWISNTEAFRSMVHRVAGVVLTLVAIHHVWFLFFHHVGKQQRHHFRPALSDFRDLFHNIGWMFGRRKERPRFGRFSYMEKAEYWALVWGTIVMVLTGFVLWFEDSALRVMPLWLWEVCQVMHRFEAILAFLAIVVWHFYYVFVNPDESPLALTFITGRMTLHELATAHPAEYEQVVRARREESAAEGQSDDSGPGGPERPRPSGDAGPKSTGC